jgi:Domain of unknown function (DUF4132)
MTTVEQLRARLAGPAPDHARFTGPAIDITGITPAELGSIWPLLLAARGTPGLQPLVDDVFRQVAQSGITPVLDSAALAATLRARQQGIIGNVSVAELVACCEGEPGPEVAQALAAVLPNVSNRLSLPRRNLALALLGGLGDVVDRLERQVERAGANLPAREFAVLKTVGRRVLLALARVGDYGQDEVEARRWQELADELGQEPAYLEFARDALEEAAATVQRIHAGTVPYKADTAFTREDAEVLELAARVAGAVDAPWYGDAIMQLLPAVCVAPNTHKTAPSQSVTTVLGQAIEAHPTPESVAALREALRVVRHATLKKRLTRNLKPAERGLAARPEVALRLGDIGLPPKQQRALLAAFFDTALGRPFTLPYRAWRERLLAGAAMAEHARALVWAAHASFMLGEGDVPVDAAGNALAVPDDAPVTLWHPVEAGAAEREAWRARLLHLRLRQPVRQVFREFYPRQPGDEAACAQFAGYELSAMRLLGLARREGWKLEDGYPVRRFGDLRVTFNMSYSLYPGCGGTVASGTLAFARGRAAVPVREVPPRVLSEVCRAADLLVSVATVALEDDGKDWSRLHVLTEQAGVHALRRQVLERLLHAQIAAGRVAIEGFHVHAGGAQVSMRTGRVLKGGMPVELELAPASKRLGAVPWLPYDEALLERVVRTVGVLLGPAGPA